MRALLLAAGLVAAGIHVAGATTLSGRLTADNVFVAFLSTDDNVLGTQIASGNDFTFRYDFNQPLVTGTAYYLHIVGVNFDGLPHNPQAGNPDGLIGRFTLSDAGFAFANGAQDFVTEATANWRAQATGGADPWFAPVGTPVLREDNGAGGFYSPYPELGSAGWIWAAVENGVGRAFFSTTITPLVFEEVPAPGGLPLIAVGLAAFGLLKRRQR